MQFNIFKLMNLFLRAAQDQLQMQTLTRKFSSGKRTSKSSSNIFILSETTYFPTGACSSRTTEICTTAIVSVAMVTSWIPMSLRTELSSASINGIASDSGTEIPIGYRTISQSASTAVILPVPTATIINSPGTFFILPDRSTVIPHQIRIEEYLLVSWIPLIIATLFAIPWRIVNNTTREIEPFYQLQLQGGATVENSLFLDYATSPFIITPFKALGRRYYIILSSSFISLAAITIASLSSETFFVSLSSACRPETVGNCHTTGGVYTILASIIEALLAIIAILTVLIIILGVRRNSEVFADPLSIISLGTLINHLDILREFRAIGSTTSLSKLKEMLYKSK